MFTLNRANIFTIIVAAMCFVYINLSLQLPTTSRSVIVYRALCCSLPTFNYNQILPNAQTRHGARVTFSSQEEPRGKKAWNWPGASALPSICLIYCLFAPKCAARAFYAEPVPVAKKHWIGDKQETRRRQRKR